MKRWLPTLLPAAGLALVVSGVVAQQSSAPEAGNAKEWIELQKGGTAASPVARPLPGDIAERSYERYAESFSQPIPESLKREGFIEEGGQ